MVTFAGAGESITATTVSVTLGAVPGNAGGSYEEPVADHMSEHPDTSQLAGNALIGG